MTFNGGGADSLVVNATGANAGTASFQGAAAFNFSGINTLTYNDNASGNALTINNPAAGLFAPAGGINYNGGTFGTLNDFGGGSGAADAGVYTPTSGIFGNGTLTHTEPGPVTQTINFTGLSPRTTLLPRAPSRSTAPPPPSRSTSSTAP